MGVVEWAIVVFVAEKVVAAGDAAGTGSGKVRGVRKDAEDHLRRAEDFLSVGVGCGVARRRSSRAMLVVVGEACSEAKAQVAGKTRASTARP